jgi:hypothetical protein
VLNLRTSPCVSIPLLCCTDFDIVQILHSSTIDIQDKPPHRPRRTLRPTDRNIKSTVWNAHSTPARYHAQSSAPEESGTGNWFPIEFNEEHACWVEVHLQEPAGSEAYWQAFRIAGEDLGVDITQGDVEFHHQNTALTSYRESVASSHSSRVSTPSVPSIIRPSPHQPGSRDQEIAHMLAESLNINAPMSSTLTMEVPAGTINPLTGHVNADDAALYQAIGPDQPDPPSMSSTDRTTHVLRLRRKDLVSVVMTMWAESRISHGLFVVQSWLTDPSADVAPISYCSPLSHAYRHDSFLG